ncbi:OB-fold protein [Winogradskyella pulchriflava]|uniref:tRNA_anti-like n=1 Tax=Winogradskyella pulchriflava TaxID=1110688 RepID=A0ABV6Q4T1_9FLAO
MLKRIVIFGIIIVAAIVGYNYIYQDHRSIENEKAEFVLTSNEIAVQFSENLLASEQTYLNKTIEVSGLISEINTNNITLDDKVFCQFSEAVEPSIKDNSKLKIKGRVIGYDDLLEQVKLDQCTIIN